MNTRQHICARVLVAASPLLGPCIARRGSLSQAADDARSLAEMIVELSRHADHDLAIAMAVASALPLDRDEIAPFIRRAAATANLMHNDICAMPFPGVR